ncbi:chemotaxis protein MotC [Microvirga sp. 3-52]|uniref:chemotaxis protein MotC n=1 Tax=Microvirga sp. 3-52 TaxID=2792425 RepID=UPI001AD49AB3|nr:chemotaxis protein MotC [Microvirga sp. 3-52]MBO1904421.1 chemotaxis protein MotC [Microvirga sp. 3-52]MBS7451409.1 chemotaxis protein MotC [Microvirga sp. 3-52]
MKGLSLAALLAPLMLSSVAVANEQPSETVMERPAEPETSALTAPGPMQLVRTLHLMQDQIAIGSTEAHAGQRGLLSILDERFMSLEAETWQTSKNVRAAVSLVLSGGNPSILRKLLELGSSIISESDKPLIEGALAYVEGREEAAQTALASLDPHSLPPTLGAQLALVQSALNVRKNAAKSDELLDFVRLQAPGTLLEEAALRRQVFVASQTNNIEKFQSLATEYLRRYRHSIYAGNFRQRLASALTRIDFGQESSRFDGMVEMMTELEPEARRDLYLLAARSSIEQGFTTSARLLADKAQELARADKASATRAKLYRAASMITSPQAINGAVEDLRGLDRSVLPDSDLSLLESALSMAGQIRKMPDAPAPQIVEGKPALTKVAAGQSTEGATPVQGLEQLQALSKARDALSRVDQLIKN